MIVLKEFLLSGIHGQEEIILRDIETAKKIIKIPLPFLAHAVKALENGWIIFAGMNYNGMLTYNLYKDKYFPGVFKYTTATIHGMQYFKEKKFYAKCYFFPTEKQLLALT